MQWGGINDPSEIYELKIALNVDGKDFVQSAQGTTEELSAKVFTFSDLEVSAEVFARCDVLEDNELIWSGKSEPIVISEGTNDIEIMMKKVQQDEPPVEEHEHTFSEDWTSDETHHWHAATCEHTSEVSGKAVHTWNEGEVTKNATEEDDGEKTFTCTVCGRTKTEVIIALNHVHTISESWSSDETHHWHEASCEKTEHNTEKAAHTLSGWTVTTPATTSSEGVEKILCTVCGREFSTRTISKLKYINGVECLKTEEIDVCTTSTTIAITDNSSWSGYLATSAPAAKKGVYIKNRTVTLSPFAMGKYEVTQELFEAVMKTNPSYCTSNSTTCVIADGETAKLRPAENMNWYGAIAFCNKLSILEGLEPCYTVSGIDDWSGLEYSDIPTTSNATWNAVTCDFTKKGYRLPTEAEWEFASRGGNANADEWKYAFSGVNVSEGNMVYNGSYYLSKDANLEEYAWYKSNAQDIGSGNKGYGTHEVGTKKPNSLGLYDMSGNVKEMCWDMYSSTVGTGAVTDPTGTGTNSGDRLERGGSWQDKAYGCTVSDRTDYYPFYSRSYLGIRLARSL